MHSFIQQKEKKFVPRFRRRNENKNLIDADDEEAQALIEKDLQSNFKWTSDLTEDYKHQFDNSQDENLNNQQISINDEINENLIYDIDNNNNNQQLWNINIENNEKYFIKWTHDQQQQKISFSIENIQDKKQQWTLNENNDKLNQFNLIDENDHLNKYNLDTINQNQQIKFIQEEQFRHQIKFGIESSNEELNIFSNNIEDIQTISFDSNIPSIQLILSLPQTPIILNWLEGISQYQLSLPVEQLFQQYSPLNQTKYQIDLQNLKSLKWSIELLKENLVRSYLISLPNTEHNQLSLPDKFYLNLSINEQNNEQLFSLIDNSFKQTISLSSNDIKQQLLTIIDSIEIKQNFGYENEIKFYKWSLKELKTIILNISPEEFFNIIYSPNDVKSIQLEHLLIESDEISARAFRRHRCKHMSIQNDQQDQLDSQQLFHLLFKGNEQIAIGEQQIQNDLDQQQIYRDITNNDILLKDNLPQCYDITTSDSSPVNLGPCLFRSDYERDPPSTWSHLRREIGYISYDASLSQPTYYLDKSFKRFVHIPKKRSKCSYNVYRGYQEFIEKIRLNSSNYFRPFDSTDLRHLLYWYSQKQYLFSLTNQNMLKPPTFICRRTVLRTIIANLYCDSHPWKLLVIRIKGQFYLTLANKATKKAEDITEDEYSGYQFEQLFTTDQPNTTRFNEKIPLEKPQQQFHTVQYWQFGQFNILYSNEIDGEFIADTQQKSKTTEAPDPIKEEDNSTKVTSTENVESKTIEMNWWEGGISSQIQNSSEEIEDEINENIELIQDELKLAQINENLQLIDDESKQIEINESFQLIKSDKNKIIEKKKRNEFELKSGYVEMKCTNKKIFYRDENKLQTLHWWAQMWLSNTNTLMIGYKTSNDGIIDQLDLFSIQQLIYKFLSKYDLHLKFCFSYLYSFLNLIQNTIHIDDPNTIHAFTYIPQPLEIDPTTGQTIQLDLPKYVPFRYTQIKRSNQRHSNFMPQWYLQHIQRTIPIGGILQDQQLKTVEQETKKRIGHRGRSNCILKQQQQQNQVKRRKRKIK